MKKSTIITIVIVVIVIIVAIVAFTMRSKSAADMSGQTPTTTTATSTETDQDAAAEDVITEFGQQLQKVSLLAPDASSTMEEFYGPYVAPELLSAWEADPSKAPGKTTSSPWPDHIQITDVQKADGAYNFRGQIVLMTSNEVEHGGIAGVQDFTATVSDASGTSLITSFTLGQFASGAAS